MNPALKLWMYEQWIQDLEDKHKMAESYVIMLGSFTNSEMAHRMRKAITPDWETSDEEFEKLSKNILAENKKIKKRKRTLING